MGGLEEFGLTPTHNRDSLVGHVQGTPMANSREASKGLGRDIKEATKIAYFDLE